MGATRRKVRKERENGLGEWRGAGAAKMSEKDLSDVEEVVGGRRVTKPESLERCEI